jgi:ATP-dependent helicase HrpA
MELEKDLGWLWKDLKKVEKMGLDLLVIGSSEVVRQQAFENARKHLLDVQLPAALTSVYFNQLVAASRRKIPGLADELQKRISRILEERNKLMSIRDPYPGLPGDLNTLAPADFLKRMSFERLAELPRYLAAMRIRSERASVNPSKDREKLARLRPALDRYQSILEKWNNRPARQTMEMYEQIDSARWMIEEWKVILFAQELKSAIPVSDEKVRNKLDTVYLSL